MNLTHLHLILNHIPLLGTFFGAALLLLGLIRRSSELKATAMATLVLVAAVTVPVFLTGEPAEEAVGSLAGVSKPLIEKHERAATVALGGTSVLGMVAVAGLVPFFRQRRTPKWIGVTILIGSMGVGGLMAWTATLGGQIRHSEIRTAGSAPIPTSTEGH
jgi:uncharacterized membrane protein